MALLMCIIRVSIASLNAPAIPEAVSFCPSTHDELARFLSCLWATCRSLAEGCPDDAFSNLRLEALGRKRAGLRGGGSRGGGGGGGGADRAGEGGGDTLGEGGIDDERIGSGGGTFLVVEGDGTGSSASTFF